MKKGVQRTGRRVNAERRTKALSEQRKRLTQSNASKKDGLNMLEDNNNNNHNKACDDGSNSNRGNGKRSLEQQSVKSESDTALCTIEHSNLSRHRVVSVPTLLTISQCIVSHNLKKRMMRADSSLQLRKKPNLNVPPGEKKNGACKLVRPDDHLKAILKNHGYSTESSYEPSIKFLPIKDQQHASYARAAMAARREDLDALTALHQEGLNLQCANTFGESIIHIVCRRGNSDILKFLIEEAKVTVGLRDDLGRTPLHDAAWTDRPNFEVVKLLLGHTPELMFVKDNRGNSALGYIPSQNWALWNNFMDENKGLFLPKTPAETKTC